MQEREINVENLEVNSDVIDHIRKGLPLRSDDSHLAIVFRRMVLVIFLAVGIWFIVIWIFNIEGAIGDAFAPLTALFSGLAFAGLIYTIQLQRYELTLQRQEIRDNRFELQRAAAAQEKTEVALAAQSRIISVEFSARVAVSLSRAEDGAWILNISNTGKSPSIRTILCVDRPVYVIQPKYDNWRGRTLDVILISSLANFSAVPFMLMPGQSLKYALSDRDLDGSRVEANEFVVTATYETATGDKREESTTLNRQVFQGVWTGKSTVSLYEDVKRLLESKRAYWQQILNDLRLIGLSYPDDQDKEPFETESDLREFVARLFEKEESLFPKDTMPSGMLWHRVWMKDMRNIVDVPLVFFNYLDAVDAIMNLIDDAADEYRKILSVIVAGQFSQNETFVLIHVVPALQPRYEALRSKLIKSSFVRKLPGFYKVLMARTRPGWDCGGFEAVLYQE